MVPTTREVLLVAINVLRRMNLTVEQAGDEQTIRQFCHRQMKRTLPDAIRIDVIEPDEETRELYQWRVLVYEHPDTDE